MALVLVKEDGSGMADANSYANVADADAYFDGHLYATAWSAATTPNKEKALVWATRLIDSQFQFNGSRSTSSQALQWPRQECPDPDEGGAVVSLIWWRADRCVASDVVPKAVADATCEMARELVIVDRTAAPAGEGILSEWNATEGTRYEKSDRRPIISHVAQAMLVKFGSLVGSRSGVVRLTRA